MGDPLLVVFEYMEYGSLKHMLEIEDFQEDQLVCALCIAHPLTREHDCSFCLRVIAVKGSHTATPRVR